MAHDLFDTHCHLNLPDLFPEPDAEIERSRAAGVDRLALVGIDADSSVRACEIAERHKRTYAIVGWHPNSAAAFTPAGFELIATLLDRPQTIALGEIGLDYHWDFATKRQQQECLAAQLNLAQARDIPVVFHCREAYDDLLDLLESRPTGRWLFHCFSGSLKHAERIRVLGGWIGVDGPLTYRKAEELRAIVREWPRDRLVLETDSPYLTPEPHRGKSNHPTLLPLINARLASIWEIEPEESARLTTGNALEFFRIAEG